MMNDRIKLAEAMGWTHDEIDENCWHSPDDDPKGPWTDTAYLPDPETDANDDYAVLEWMHADSTDFGTSQRFMKHLQFQAHQYRVGDYARAALKVISGRPG